MVVSVSQQLESLQFKGKKQVLFNKIQNDLYYSKYYWSLFSTGHSDATNNFGVGFREQRK